MATKRWLGNAAAVYDLWTVTLSGTVTSQTFTMTINSKSITYTSTGTDTVNSVITGLIAAWNSLLPLPAPEFQEMTAAGLPVGGPFTSMTVTGDSAGKPSTITVGTSGAATFSIANTAPATGPNDFANAQNWSTASAPANSDVLIFDNGSVPCKYNLNSSLTGITLNVNPGYTGAIGLPLINADAATTYNEYRTTSLTFAGGTVLINAPSMQRCNLAFGANTTTIRVLATGRRVDTYTPVVLITGGNSSSELDITAGDVAVAYYQGTTATFPTIKSGYATNPLSDVTFQAGPNATLTTIVKNGGNATLRCSATTVSQDAAGGTLTFSDTAAVTTLNAYGGTVYLSSTGTITTVNLYGSAILNCDADPRSKTITNAINVYATGVSIVDSQKSINSGVLTLAPSGLASVNVTHGANISIVYT